jgi:hypothetical protein
VRGKDSRSDDGVGPLHVSEQVPENKSSTHGGLPQLSVGILAV